MKKLISLIFGLLMMGSAFSQSITVFAASSMTDAMQQVATAFRETHPQAEIKFSFASSATLARQISQGAPANIYISADQKWMNYLDKQKLIVPSSLRYIASNQLVVIAPVTSKLNDVQITNEFWLKNLQKERLALGDPAYVPAGIYAKQALESLKQWSIVEPHLAKTNNVRSALMLVARGESPLGIVYRSDGLIAPQQVKIIATFPQSSHTTITYPAAEIVDEQTALSQAFMQFLVTPRAKNIFAKFGFNQFPQTKVDN